MFAEWTAEVVVQTPLYAVLTEGVTTGSGDWFEEQPADSKRTRVVPDVLQSEVVVVCVHIIIHLMKRSTADNM